MGGRQVAGRPGLTPLLTGIAVYIFLMPFAARLPVNYPLVYVVVLALPILANRPRVRREFCLAAASNCAPGANAWAARRSSSS